MSLSINRFYTKSVIFVIATFGLFNQTIAHPSSRALLGLRSAIGGITSLPAVKEHATEHGYKQVTTPFCHLDLEGTLYVERKLLNHVSYRLELGYTYMHLSFTGEPDQRKIKQSIGLHCHGGHFSPLLYFYPNGIFADKRNWNGHIGFSFSFVEESKNMYSHIQTKKNNRFSNGFAGPVLGIGFEFISGLQLECRYRCMVKLFESLPTTDLQGISLSIGYLFK